LKNRSWTDLRSVSPGHCKNACAAAVGGAIFLHASLFRAEQSGNNLSIFLNLFITFIFLFSQFAIVEVVVTSIQDGFPNWIKKRLVYHELLVLIVCIVSFFFGLPNLIQSGIYFFQLIDHYAASVSIMFLAFFQTIAIAWFYGVGRLSKNVKQMTGKAPSLYFRSSWAISAPLLLIVSVTFFCVGGWEF
jgi:SNF family Na+-dependent transporter